MRTVGYVEMPVEGTESIVATSGEEMDALSIALELMSVEDHAEADTVNIRVVDSLIALPRSTKIHLLAQRLSEQKNALGLVNLWTAENIRGLQEYALNADRDPRAMHFPVVEPVWGQVYRRFRRYLVGQGENISLPIIESVKSGETYVVGNLGSLCLAATYCRTSSGDLINVTYTATKPSSTII